MVHTKLGVPSKGRILDQDIKWSTCDLVHQVRDVYWTGISNGPHVTRFLVLLSHVWTT